jgi:putative sugar O-methyltransferase
MNSSLTDVPWYVRVCLEASRDPELFARFRREPAYNQALEHVSGEQGLEYLRRIAGDAAIMAALPELRKNDSVGGPRVFAYPAVGHLSPTTLRYIKVLKDLKAHFGALDDFEICEIGVGYGGQCRIIDAFYRPRLYQLVDIEAALLLAKRYLSEFPLRSPVTFRTMAEVEPRPFDLVISNYAFSELRRPVQELYFDAIVGRAARGYLTCNRIAPPEFEVLSPETIAERIPGARLLPEEPLTHAGNCVVEWGATS